MKWKVGSGIMMVAILVTMVIMYINRPQFAYVDTLKLHDGFELRIELENKLKTVQMAREHILDSLELNFKHKAKIAERADPIDAMLMSELELLQQQYMLKKKEFGEDNQAMLNQYNVQISNQLNQYMKDFGDQNGYGFIYGANGTGSLMYANDGYDVTETAIEYINSRYSGNSK